MDTFLVHVFRKRPDSEIVAALTGVPGHGVGGDPDGACAGICVFLVIGQDGHIEKPTSHNFAASRSFMTIRRRGEKT
jgi:hypothetical protein